MQLLGLHVVLLLKCFLVVFGQQYHTHHDVADLHWKPATATWYGSPDGDGSNGGACGYGSLVDVKPLRARVGAVSPILFKNGEGCGACYKVRCLDKSICSERAVTIIVTDECPGGYCSNGNTHFDLSGAAFGHMAISGENGQLRNRGEIPVIYRRTPCKYPGKNIAFHVNEGSTDYWLSLLVEFEDGDGDVESMHIREVTFSFLNFNFCALLFGLLTPPDTDVKLQSRIKKSTMLLGSGKLGYVLQLCDAKQVALSG